MEVQNQSIVLLRAPKDEDTKEDDYVKILETLGLSVISIPTLEFQFQNLDELLNCLKNPEDYSGIVFTSPRSVEAVRQCFMDFRENELVKKWQLLKCYAVGHATAETSEKLLNLTCRGEQSGNADNLARFIAEDLTNFSKPLLFPCSSISRPTLPQQLRQKEIYLKSIAVYDTKSHSELLTRLNCLYAGSVLPKYVVFFSPSGVKNSLSFFKDTEFSSRLNSKFIAIGSTTAELLIKSGFKLHCTAPSPTAKGLLQAIVQSEIN